MTRLLAAAAGVTLGLVAGVVWVHRQADPDAQELDAWDDGTAGVNATAHGAKCKVERG